MILLLPVLSSLFIVALGGFAEVTCDLSPDNSEDRGAIDELAIIFNATSVTFYEPGL